MLEIPIHPCSPEACTDGCGMLSLIGIAARSRYLRVTGPKRGTDVFPRIRSQAAVYRSNVTKYCTGRGLVDFSWPQKTPFLRYNSNQPLCLASAGALIQDPPRITLLTPRYRSPKPPVVLAHLARTQKSLVEHGENVRAEWAPDGSKIVIQARVSVFFLSIQCLTGSDL